LTARCLSAPFFLGQKHHYAQAPSNMNHNQKSSHGASEFWFDTAGLHAINSLF
jgi:hypothetical protein